MNAAQRDRAIGRRLARSGMRLSRSDRMPYPFERLARYRQAASGISPDLYCTVADVKPAQQVPIPTPRARRRAKDSKQ